MILLENSLKEHFKYSNTIMKIDLSKFYLHEKPYLSDSELFWLIHSLKQEKIIKEIETDIYQLIPNLKTTHAPKIESRMLAIVQDLGKLLGLTDYCIWASDWFNPFMVHQVIRRFILIEVEQDAAEPVFNALRDNHYKDTFLMLHKSDELMLERYVFEAQEAIIVKKIISKSPIQKVIAENTTIKTPKLEKMLVDLFCEEQLFLAYKDYEQQNIFGNALTQHEINFKTLFSYAERRKKETQLREYLFRHFELILKKITI